jgi:hypothetical protein
MVWARLFLLQLLQPAVGSNSSSSSSRAVAVTPQLVQQMGIYCSKLQH